MANELRDAEIETLFLIMYIIWLILGPNGFEIQILVPKKLIFSEFKLIEAYLT